LPSGLPPFGPGEIGIEPTEMKKRSESLIPKPDNTLPDPACRSPRTAPMPGLRLRFIATRLHLDLRNVKARPSDGPLRRDDQSRHRLRKGSGVRVPYRLYSYRRFNLVLWINPYVNKQVWVTPKPHDYFASPIQIRRRGRRYFSYGGNTFFS
jgi:hypothetical protein